MKNLQKYNFYQIFKFVKNQNLKPKKEILIIIRNLKRLKTVNKNNQKIKIKFLKPRN